MSDTLRECPFCGGETILELRKLKYGTVYSVYCQKCGAEIVELSEHEAVAAWNRRAQPENKPLTLDELKQMDEEPVYIVTLENQLENPPYWAIVGISKNDSRYQGGVTLYNKTQGDWGSIELYGKTWLAYRHKTKEEHHEAD